MRLIDADALKTIYEDRRNILEKVYGPFSELGVIEGAIRLLDMQPTIEPEPCEDAVHAAYKHGKSKGIKKGLGMLKDAQPEITDEQAIEHLQASGWMQNHDKQMYEMGLREQLADGSDSYDALLPSAQPERLTDDDFETIRIHLSAYKEKLCNQHRWKEAEEYQRLIGRFMAFASAQSVPYEEDGELDFVQEHKKLPIILETRGKANWIEVGREEGALEIQYKRLRCSRCGWESSLPIPRNFCPNCGADMRKDAE